MEIDFVFYHPVNTFSSQNLLSNIKNLIAMDAIAERTKKIIADMLGAEESEITPETDLYKHLGADSLDVVEVVVTLEKEFGVTIPDEKIERMTKVRHFTEHFEKVKAIPEAFYIEKAAA